MNMSFQGQVALVTGAAMGMGLATARAFAEAGAALALADRAEKAVRARLGRPDEIASAVLWRCSPGASFVIGHALSVDGGYTVQ